MKRIYHQPLDHATAKKDIKYVSFTQNKVWTIYQSPIFCREETKLLMPQRRTARQPYAQDPRGPRR